MVKIGCLARFNNPYEEEVEFAKKNNFKLMQVWYDRDGIRNYESEENRLDKIIFEVTKENADIVKSKEIIESLMGL